MSKRKSKQVNISLKCDDNNYQASHPVKMSVRNNKLAIFVPDGVWAHLSLNQAKRLQSYLTKAIAEIEARDKATWATYNKTLREMEILK